MSDAEIEESFPEILVLVCEEGDDGGASGYQCESYSAEEAKELAEANGIDAETPLQLEEGQRLDVCWPDGGGMADPIMRSMVIGEELWTLSYSLLQANDLFTLDRTQQVH